MIKNAIQTIENMVNTICQWLLPPYFYHPNIFGTWCRQIYPTNLYIFTQSKICGGCLKKSQLNNLRGGGTLHIP